MPISSPTIATPPLDFIIVVHGNDHHPLSPEEHHHDLEDHNEKTTVMSKRQLVQQYRRQQQKHHPSLGRHMLTGCNKMMQLAALLGVLHITTASFFLTLRAAMMLSFSSVPGGQHGSRQASTTSHGSGETTMRSLYEYHIGGNWDDAKPQHMSTTSIEVDVVNDSRDSTTSLSQERFLRGYERNENRLKDVIEILDMNEEDSTGDDYVHEEDDGIARTFLSPNVKDDFDTKVESDRDSIDLAGQNKCLPDGGDPTSLLQFIPRNPDTNIPISSIVNFRTTDAQDDKDDHHADRHDLWDWSAAFDRNQVINERDAPSDLLDHQMDDDNVTIAVCEFQPRYMSGNYAVAMQQLYRCWSYWQANADKQRPVLLHPADHANFPPQHLKSLTEKVAFYESLDYPNYMSGFLRAMIQVFDVELTSERPPSHIPVATPNMEMPEVLHYAVERPEHLRTLAKGVIDYYQPKTIAQVSPKEDHEEHNQCLAPRIAIWNCVSCRTPIINAHDLGRDIETQILSQGGNELHTEVSIMYHDYLPLFDDQVAFFNDHDIVLSPTGAHLVGAGFMPICGAIMEFFPRGYYQPAEFGSLAAASGIEYQAVYLSKADLVDQEQVHSMSSPSSSLSARTQSMCPNHEIVLDAVKDMVGRWTKCCKAVTAQDSYTNTKTIDATDETDASDVERVVNLR